MRSLQTDHLADDLEAVEIVGEVRRNETGGDHRVQPRLRQRRNGKKNHQGGNCGTKYYQRALGECAFGVPEMRHPSGKVD